MNEQKLRKKLIFMIVTVVILIFGLTVTSFALASSIVRISHNRFTLSAGLEERLVINGGKPVVDMTDVIYEPGGTYISEFTIANLADFDVWYRVYFTDVEGVLKDYITVTVKEVGGKELCRGKMSELSSDKVYISELSKETEKRLYIEFYFSPASGNAAQGQTVSFNITADAIQKQNNPEAFGD